MKQLRRIIYKEQSNAWPTLKDITQTKRITQSELGPCDTACYVLDTWDVIECDNSSVYK